MRLPREIIRYVKKDYQSAFVDVSDAEYQRYLSHSEPEDLIERMSEAIRSLCDKISTCKCIEKRERLWLLKKYSSHQQQQNHETIHYFEIIILILLNRVKDMCPCEINLFFDFITCDTFKVEYFTSVNHYVPEEQFIQIKLLSKTLLDKLSVDDFMFCHKLNINVPDILIERGLLDKSTVFLNHNYIRAQYITHSLPLYLLDCVSKFKVFFYDFFYPKLQFCMHDEFQQNNKTDSIINLFNSQNGRYKEIDSLALKAHSDRLNAEELLTMKMVLTSYPTLFADQKITLKQINNLILLNPKIFFQINKVGANEPECRNIYSLYPNLNNFTLDAIKGIILFFKYCLTPRIIDCDELLSNLIAYFSNENHSDNESAMIQFSELTLLMASCVPFTIYKYWDSLKIIFQKYDHIKSCNNVVFYFKTNNQKPN